MSTETRSWLDRPLHPALPAFTREIAIFAAVLVLAVVTRFYDLGSRVMSHDESLHTYFSWLLYRGQGYQHSPMMHGPGQFHMLALVYFLFGANDFTSRIPAALFGVAAIWMIWYWRRYLGKVGALTAAFLMVISPYMLYYSRYTRNEAFAAFSGVLMLYAILRYLETGSKKYIFLVTAALLLHFTTKETSFIYTAQALLFLAANFIARVTRQSWPDHESDYRRFIVALAAGIALIAFAFILGRAGQGPGVLSATETAAPADPGALTPLATEEGGPSLPVILSGIGIAAFAAAAYFLLRGYGWNAVRGERSFDLLIMIGTIVLPMLTPFLLKIFHWKIPTEVAEVNTLTSVDLFRLGAFIIPAFLLSIFIGVLWNRDVWWKAYLLFWSIFTVLFTTVFTNSAGFFTGIIGSLGYWLVQQGVERGSQPWYYYILIQIPIYEFLPALGSVLAIVVVLRRRLGRAVPPVQNDAEWETVEANFGNTTNLLIWWSVSSIVAFTIAGEKMPWLTVHMAWPMILLTGWGLNHVITTTDWEGLRQRHPWLTLAAMFVFLTSMSASLIALSGPTPPFQGQSLEQLQATGDFLLPALAAAASAAGLYYLLRNWSSSHAARLMTLTLFAILSILTARASFRAAYINYDNATEYLVYAHAATSVKEIMAQAAEISRRTTGGLNVAIAYDASQPDTGVSWPVVWYLRDYTNQRSFDVPTRSLRDAVIVIVDQKNFDKIDAALGDGYYRFDYIRMWWPNQDYFTLSTPRDPNLPFDENYACRGLLGFYRWNKSRDYSPICNSLTDPNMRAGIIDIWLNRDFTRYGQALAARDPAANTARFTLAQWDPADLMRLYIRKDVASQIWNYGVGPSVSSQAEDPTLGKVVDLTADVVLDGTQAKPIFLNAPRGLAFAPDGTFYAADSRNHRILHLDTNGTVLHEWGAFGDANISADSAPIGTFNEPWGVAVGPDGSVYVSDTWNHRVQKFTATGTPLAMWGQYGLPGTIEGFWGPRGIAVDKDGRVFVADTGNKRIMVFDKNGNYLTEFGSAGLDPGQFDEPVGIAIGADGVVYVTDTWNQRVQSFIPAEDGLTFTPYRQWDVYGWFGQSVDNKPFIAVNAENHVFVTDPEGYRVMEFTDSGELVRVWGDYGDTLNTFGMTSGIAVDAEGHIWVTDSFFNRIMRFTLPGFETISPPVEPSPTEFLPIEPTPTGPTLVEPTSTEVVPVEPTPTATLP